MSLNSKKSWHPGKSINRAKVAKREEEEALKREYEDRKRVQIEEERELEKLRANAVDTPQTSKSSWNHANKISNNNKDSSVDDSDRESGNEPEPSTKQAARKAAADPLAAILSRTQALSQRKQDGKVSKQTSQKPRHRKS